MATVLETTERPDSFVMPPWPVHRFTLAEYQNLRDAGAFVDHRVELLEGWIVPKVTQNPPHAWTVTHVGRVLTPSLSDDWLMRVQCAINTQDSEPEPGIAIVRTPEDRYLNSHPRGEDIGLLIEVADTSTSKDVRKAAIYAAEGIPTYWIVNLIDRCIEVHTRPDSASRQYQDEQVFSSGEVVPLGLDGREIARIPVDDLLPPRDDRPSSHHAQINPSH